VVDRSKGQPQCHTTPPQAGLIEVSAACPRPAMMGDQQVRAVHRRAVWPVFLFLGGNAPSKDHVMTQSNILGLVALAVGALLLFFGWRASVAPVDQMTEALTGRFSGNTMWYLIAGVAAAVAGIALLVRGSTRG